MAPWSTYMANRGFAKSNSIMHHGFSLSKIANYIKSIIDILISFIYLLIQIQKEKIKYPVFDLIFTISYSQNYAYDNCYDIR